MVYKWYFFVVYKLLILLEITNFSKKTRWGGDTFCFSFLYIRITFYFDVYNFMLHFLLKRLFSSFQKKTLLYQSEVVDCIVVG